MEEKINIVRGILKDKKVAIGFSGGADSTFIAYLMRSPIGRRIMSILAQGATRYNLSKNSFCKAELLLPKTKAEQQQIVNYFTSLDSQIALQMQRLKKLKQIKSACLDDMFV